MTHQAPHGASASSVASLSARSAGTAVEDSPESPDLGGAHGMNSSVPLSRQHLSPVPSAEQRTPRDRHENGHVVWRVQCGDLIDRERCLTVYVDDDEVVLVGPPGETARLTGTQLGQLRAALGEAAKLAER